MNEIKYKKYLYKKVEQLDPTKTQQMRQKVLSDNINYPSYHIAPPYGLLNDPNGLSYYNGYYHIFYQFCPNEPAHGMKNWYHLKTKDFINYESKGIILSPQNEFDNYGIYSGGAKVINGYLKLFYTGNQRKESEDFKRFPNQCVGIMNEKDQIIERKLLIKPDFNKHTEHSRDPLPIEVKGEHFIILGRENVSNIGEYVICKTDESYEKIQEEHVLKHNFELPNVFMYECPAYLENGENEVIIFSPQGLNPKGKYNYQNIYDVVYSVSKYGDILDYTWENNNICQMDFGFDFYAPQTFKDQNNRNILIGWLGQATEKYPGDEKYQWSQMLTIPREVIIKDNKILQKPIEEMKDLRKDNINLKENNTIKNKVFELNLELEKNFEIIVGNDKYNISFLNIENDLILDRSNMQHLVNEQFGTKRYAYVENINKFKIQMFVDNSSIEIFINDGEIVFSSRYFIDEITQINIKNLANGTLYYLNNININY